METPNNLQNSSRWENLDRNILAKIFGMLNIIDIIMGASSVCKSWFLASHNRVLWKSVNLSNLKSIIVNNPEKAKFPSNDDEEGRYQLRDILIKITKFSNTITRNLVFDFYHYLQEEDLAIIAERMSNLEKISLPLWRNLNGNVIQVTFSKWKNLQTLIITRTCLGPNIDVDFRAIGENCKNLINLKLMHPLNQDLAEQIVSKFHNLKRLSFRCTTIYTEAILSLVIGHENLKILNIRHCFYAKIEDNDYSRVRMFPELDLVQAATQKLDTFFACTDYCNLCKEFWEIAWRDDKPDYMFDMFFNEQWSIDEIHELEF